MVRFSDEVLVLEELFKVTLPTSGTAIIHKFITPVSVLIPITAPVKPSLDQVKNLWKKLIKAVQTVLIMLFTFWRKVGFRGGSRTGSSTGSSGGVSTISSSTAFLVGDGVDSEVGVVEVLIEVLVELGPDPPPPGDSIIGTEP